MNKHSPLNSRSFRAWLMSKKPRDVVGIAVQDANCPIATHLKEKMQSTYISIDNQYNFQAGNEMYALPKWAERFIQLIDRKGSGASITARVALNALDHATK